MAAKPLAMEQLKQLLKLKQEGHSIKNIKRLCGLARNTVKTYLKRLPEATAVTTTDKELAGLFYNQDTALQQSSRLQQLLHHFEGIEKELTWPGVTRQLLWGE
jgi:DNA-binding NarL/FixJ family response regulator